jgi:peptide/nickel transport system substrate-binding protein
MTRRGGAGRVAGCVAALVCLGLTGCTSSPAPEPSPDRPGGVVVAVDVPFGSLNPATADGRLPGSELVRSLVQDGFVALDEDGAAVPDDAFGTVEKVDDDPLTVRYTIAPTAVWSDGVPVTTHDLLLEWAARSGSFDDVVPRLGEQGEITNSDELDAGVAFAATSPALVHAEEPPTVDDQGRLVVVYARPVADWPVALDVNVPAHVLGRTALGAVEDPAAAVTDAITHADTEALSAVAHAWRTVFQDDELAASTADAVTTGPYVVSAVLPDQRVELTRNPAYRGSRPARSDTVVVRSDLHPLDQVTALAGGEVDVVAPVATTDVRAALDEVGAVTATAGDAAWQLVVQAAGTGVLAAGTNDESDDGTGDTAAARVREAFWLTVPRDEIVAEVARLWPDATVTTSVLPVVGPAAGGAVATGSADLDRARTLLAGTGLTQPVPVRLLASTADPLRAQVVEQIVEAAGQAGFAVTIVGDPATDLWAAPETWDVALVPAAQGALPAATVAATWGDAGAANVTGWSDPRTDDAIAELTATTDPARLPDAYATVAQRLAEGGALLPLTGSPALTAVAPAPQGATASPGLPDVGEVEALRLSRADLTDWWDWATD